MLFGFRQLKTTVFVLFLASCLGQELFRTCDSDYCYERSVELRTADPNDLREWYRYRGENLENFFVEDHNRRDANNERINEFDKHALNRKIRIKYLLREESHKETTDGHLSRAKSDVTRHLNVKSDDLTSRTDNSRVQRQTLRKFEERDKTKLERKERYDVMLNKPKTERDEMRFLENTRQSRRIDYQLQQNDRESRQRRDENEREQVDRDETLRRMDDRKDQREINRLAEDNHEGNLQIQRVSTQRHDETKRERHSEDNREEHHKTLNERGVQRKFNKLSGDTRDTIRESRQLRDENNRERVVSGETLRRFDNREESQETLRKYNQFKVRGTSDTQSKYQQLPRREQASTQRRDENKWEGEERDEIFRIIDDHQARRQISRRSEENHEERHQISRQLNDRELQRDVSRRSYDTDDMKRLDKRLSRSEQQYKQRRDENTPEQIERDASLSQLDHYESQREISKNLEDTRDERLETLRRLDQREVQRDVSRRSDDLRDTQRIDERLSRREQEYIHRRDDNIRDRVQHGETSSRLNDRQAQREISENSEDNREQLHETLRRSDEREVQRDVSRLSDERLSRREQESKHHSKERRETLRRSDEREVQRDVSRLSDDTRDTKRLDERLSRREQESRNRRDDNIRERVQHGETLSRLNDRQAQREISRNSEDNREERLETLRRSDEGEVQRDVSRLSDDTRDTNRIDERLSRREQASRHRRDDNIRERVQHGETSSQLNYRQAQRVISRNSEDNREERCENLRRSNEREVQRDVSRLSDETRDTKRIDERLSRREQELRYRRDDNNREQVQHGETSSLLNVRQAQREISRNSEDNREKRLETLRRSDECEVGRDVSRLSDDTRDTKRIDERLSRREQESRYRRDDNNRERLQHGKTSSRLNDHQAQREISRNSEDSREERRETLRRSDERDDSRISDDTTDTKRIDERLSRREQESRHRRDDNNRERVQHGETSSQLNDRQAQREISRNSKDNREDRRETLRRLDERKVQRDVSRLSDDTRNSKRIDERLSQREQESRYRRDDNNRERVQHGEISSRLNNRQAQREISRNSEDNREDRRKTLRRLDERKVQRDVSRRLDDNHDTKRIDERLSQREQETIHGHHDNNRERVQHYKTSSRQAQREIKKSSEDYHENRLETLRQLVQKNLQGDVSIRSDDNGSLENTREYRRNKRESTENRNKNEKEREELQETSRQFTERSINRRVKGNQHSRLFQMKPEDHQRNTFQLNQERTFIVKQKHGMENRHNHRFIEDDYTVRLIVFLKKGYLFLGQGVILAFVIMKTINGKDDLKQKIPQKLRKAVAMMGF